jgi:hypothetical protein
MESHKLKSEPHNSLRTRNSPFTNKVSLSLVVPEHRKKKQFVNEKIDDINKPMQSIFSIICKTRCV